MADDFLTLFTGNPARARLLRVFVNEPNGLFTLALASKRAGISSQKAASEMSQLEKMGVIKKRRNVPAPKSAWKTKSARGGSSSRGKKKGKVMEKTWTLNNDFKYARALSMFVHEVSPMQHKSIVQAFSRVGRLQAVILSGVFVGDDTRPADIVVVVDALNEDRLEQAVRGLEPRVGKELRYAAFSLSEFRYRLTIQDRLIRDTLDYPHFVALDKKKVLK